MWKRIVSSAAALLTVGCLSNGHNEHISIERSPSN
jgi:hypothetical protein